jgi:hypothetical protein
MNRRGCFRIEFFKNFRKFEDFKVLKDFNYFKNSLNLIDLNSPKKILREAASFLLIKK